MSETESETEKNIILRIASHSQNYAPDPRVIDAISVEEFHSAMMDTEEIITEKIQRQVDIHIVSGDANTGVIQDLSSMNFMSRTVINDGYTVQSISQLINNDIDRALKTSILAVEDEGENCDAFYAHAIAVRSQTDHEDLFRMVRNILSFGDQLFRLHFFELSSLRPFVYLPGIDYRFEFFDKESLYAAYCISLINIGETREASIIIRQYFPANKKLINSLVWCALYIGVEDWPNLLKLTPLFRKSENRVIRQLGEYWCGIANARLGLLEVGKAVLQDLIDQKDTKDFIKIAALVYLGLIYRDQDTSSLAEKCFRDALAIETSDKILAIKNDPSYSFETTTAKRIFLRNDYFNPSSIDKAKEIENIRKVELRQVKLEEALTELYSQIGMWEVKRSIEILQAKILLSQRRKSAGLRSGSSTYHIALTGPPGTGKTSVARILAKLFFALGLLPTDKIMEVGRKDLVGEYLGSSAVKTQEVLNKALGGVIFIDEAYMLAQSGLHGGDAFGREAVDTILTFMDDHRDELVIILSGYANEIDRLLEVNPGLKSRVPKSINFNTYSPKELVLIAEHMCEKRDSALSEDAKKALLYAAQDKAEKLDLAGRSLIDVAGNGRWVRNVIEAAEDLRDFRLVRFLDANREDMMVISKEDILAAIESIS